MSDSVASNIEIYAEEVRELRRQFHQIPETGWEEYLTTWHIYQFLNKLEVNFDFVVGKELLASDSRLGLPEAAAIEKAHIRLLDVGADSDFINKVEGGHAGLMAIYDTGNTGPNTLFRFDIDALPIEESNDDGHFPAQEKFQSVLSGNMHACGHDSHIAIGLGFARFLESVQSQLTGKIYLLFQPAEEGCRGARAVADKGWLNNIDYLLTGHVGIEDHPIGTVAVATGEMLATSKLDVSFSGRSAHAANNPQEGQNALLAAASTALGLHGISRHSAGSSRVNVGSMTAGSGRNIIADSAEMLVELRGENNQIHDYMLERAREVISGAAMMHGVEYQLELAGQALAGNCDKDLADRIADVIEQSPNVVKVLPELLLRASEDATILMDAVQQRGGKATYLMFCSPTKGGHHHCEFDTDENVLGVAVDVMARALIDLNG